MLLMGSKPGMQRVELLSSSTDLCWHVKSVTSSIDQGTPKDQMHAEKRQTLNKIVFAYLSRISIL